MDDRIKKIAEHYGYEAQSRQLIEEMAELTQAINKKWRNENGYIDGPEEIYKARVIEEITDTEIMIEQVKYLLGTENRVKDWRERKLERTLEKIELEKMVTVIGGVHGIHYNKDYKTYYWRSNLSHTFVPGDIAFVDAKNGLEKVLVMEVKEMPESEAKRYKEVIAKGVFNDGKQQG